VASEDGWNYKDKKAFEAHADWKVLLNNLDDFILILSKFKNTNKFSKLDELIQSADSRHSDEIIVHPTGPLAFNEGFERYDRPKVKSKPSSEVLHRDPASVLI